MQTVFSGWHPERLPRENHCEISVFCALCWMRRVASEAKCFMNGSWETITTRVQCNDIADYTASAGTFQTPLFNHDVDLFLVEDSAFGEVELGERDVVVAFCEDLPGARGGEIRLRLEDEKDVAFTADELLFFGRESLLGEARRFARGLETIVAGLCELNGIRDLAHDEFLFLLHAQLGLLTEQFTFAKTGPLALTGRRAFSQAAEP